MLNWLVVGCQIISKLQPPGKQWWHDLSAPQSLKPSSPKEMLLMTWSPTVVYFISLVSNPTNHQGNLTLLVKRNINVYTAIVFSVFHLWLMQWLWLATVLCIFLLLGIAWEPWMSSHQIFFMGGKNTIVCCPARARTLFGFCIHHLRFGPSCSSPHHQYQIKLN